MKRTTILADESLLEGLRHIARKERMSLSATIRRALEEFVDRRQEEGTLPSFVGIGGSRRRDIAERVDELLWTSPHRRSKA
jgi:hypothetical protein